MVRLITFILIMALASCGGSSNDSTDNKDTASKKVDNNDGKKSKSKRDKGKKGKDQNDEDEEVIINVEAATIRLGNAKSVFRTTTILEADLESAVTSKASGIVLKINVEVGDRVEAGDILAVLESDVQELSF